jgi:hypothetical protein
MTDPVKLYLKLPKSGKTTELTPFGAIIYRDGSGLSDYVYLDDGMGAIIIGKDNTVSRKDSCREGYHTRIFRKDNGDWVARDGGSKNGTEVLRNPEGLNYRDPGNIDRNSYEINLSNFMSEAGKEPGTIDVKDASLRMFVGAKDLYLDLDLVKQ